MKKNEKDYVSHCEVVATQSKAIYDAFLSKGFTIDEAFKLLCLVVEKTLFNDVN